MKDVDMASLYLDLSSSYQITRRHEAAADAIQKATRLLEGTSQEDQIVMARAELELWKNDASKALVLLSSITPNSSVYIDVPIIRINVVISVIARKRYYKVVSFSYRRVPKWPIFI